MRVFGARFWAAMIVPCCAGPVAAEPEHLRAHQWAKAVAYYDQALEGRRDPTLSLNGRGIANTRAAIVPVARPTSRPPEAASRTWPKP